ncbi:kinase-like protein [Guyanagaster necrorhizus]|uniref:cyclin-dependent kinase n=1 Tax=Guyanagaster necrorhizus TaxID=856835 RepID=A0A9P7W4A3_9AGAR|nr:kinase-like protein [Guyanagaster necrorhizus MCA 3950]KAG7451898.1 kinase-like protein [Guyanagaster necrorhizus MCA 3950]
MSSNSTVLDAFEFEDDSSESRGEVIAVGVASTILLTYENGQRVAVKSATTSRRFAKEPHDIKKECRILSQLSYVNIIPVLWSRDDPHEHMLEICMPFIPYSLENLLAIPSFTPSDMGSQFYTISRSIIFQTLSALAYLHSSPHKIAHRDIKPSNVLLTASGCVQLIDFGVSYAPDPHAEDIWHEEKDRMYFEVSTGPYRAPELLFGARTYDPYAADMWSLGCTFAEFFTQLLPEENDDEYDYPPELCDTNSTFVRKSLFDGTRGEIGLAWSIFKIMGTPTEDSWPTFNQLPDASRVQFTVVPPVPLDSVLPHLPHDQTPYELNLLQSFLIYPPSARITAIDAIAHACFTDSVLIPPEIQQAGTNCVHQTKDGKTIGGMLEEVFTNS